MKRLYVKSAALLLNSILLASMLACFFATSSLDSIYSDDSVYCPLQKTWVKRELSETKIADDLDEICASNAKKASFDFLLKQRTIGFQPKTENLFFSFVAHGEIAFAVLNDQSKVPQPSFGQVSGLEKSAANPRHDFGKQLFAAIGLDQTPRPPNFKQTEANFANNPTRQLNQISRNIKPRSPPFSI